MKRGIEYRRLGRTGLKVSPLCLGSMQFGWTADEGTSFAVMDAFAEAGGNFIDTADIYSRWVEGNEGGESETVIGRWLRSKGNRSQMIIATKVRGQMGPGPNDEGLSRRHILDACEASLRRLQTDTIDLYQAHYFDADVPIDESLEALDRLVQQGKVRYIGCSNYPAWRLMEALWTSDKHGLVRYDSFQPHYNLVHRAEFEQELADVCRTFGIGIIPYSPLAGGFLTGKYSSERPTDSVRAASVRQRYFNDAGWRVLKAVEAVAGELGATPAAVSLAWLLAQPGVTAPIVGANTVEQLQASLNALDVELTADQTEALEVASAW
ncbi:MAG: aldo/keto reductase [Caldilineaceae bacterium]|nr:aldo/keto reductase [Caldilineaceae bacterium]MDE0339333.1 aldo/keto reductase [Caldilineaceae bacterium]